MPKAKKKDVGKDQNAGDTKPKKKPRIKEQHRVLLKHISEGIRKGKSEGEIMRELGYSEAYSKNPNHLKETRSWQELLNETLSDEELTKHHQQLLTAREIAKFDFSQYVSDEEITEAIEGYGFELVKIIEVDTQDPKFRRKTAYYLLPDNRAKKDALDMAYKLKKRYDTDFTIKHQFSDRDDRELEEELAGVISEISEGLAIEKGTGKTQEE